MIAILKKHMINKLQVSNKLVKETSNLEIHDKKTSTLTQFFDVFLKVGIWAND